MEWLDPTVPDDMPVHTVHTHLPTLLTVEWLDPTVPDDMLQEAGLAVEALVAQLTLVRLLPGVNALVFTQVPRPTEHLAADQTQVLALPVRLLLLRL